MLTDKEVGGLWLKALATHPLGYANWQLWQQALIRKLVEERKFAYMYDAEKGFPSETEALIATLHDFGIDEKDWE